MAENMEEKQNNKRSKYTHKFASEHYDRIALQVPAGEKNRIKEYAMFHGYKSLNAFIYDLIQKEIED